MLTSDRRRRERERDEQLAAVLAGLTRPEPKRRAQAAARTGRALLFRLRRPLAPLAVLAALAGTGAVARSGGVPPVAVALLAAIAAVGLWRGRYAARLDRPRERRYAAVCLIAAVVWLTLTATVGLS